MVFHVVTLFYFCSEISRNEKRDLSMVRSFEVLFGFVRRVWSFDGLYEFPGVVGISMGYVGALRSPVSLLALLMFAPPRIESEAFHGQTHSTFLAFFYFNGSRFNSGPICLRDNWFSTCHENKSRSR